MLTNFAFNQVSILEKFTIEIYSKKVLLAWTVKPGNTCNGIRIYRSEDSLTFTEIGDIQGVCGNLGYSVDYTFQDENPLKNKINYYRLDLGGIELTYTLSIEFIDAGENDFYLKPNPITEQSLIYFNNSTNQSSVLKIMSSKGEFLKQIETFSDYYILNSSDFNNGLYYFTITNTISNSPIKGKFIVSE